jgi:hypothetical protein
MRRRAALVVAIAAASVAALFMSAAASGSATIHGTFSEAETSCLEVVSPAPPGTVAGRGI